MFWFSPTDAAGNLDYKSQYCPITQGEEEEE